MGFHLSPSRALLLGAGAIALGSMGYALSRPETAAVADSAPIGTAAASPDAAIRALQEQVGVNPRDAQGWHRLGSAYFEQRRYEDAARAFRRAADIAPDTAEHWSALGEALVMADARDPMPKGAGEAFDTAVRIDPKDPRARYFLAVRRDLAGDHKGAIDDWLALLADTPPGAVWEADLRRTIAQVGKINGIDVSARLAAVAQPPAHPVAKADDVATAAIPGPTREQMRAAAALPKGAQDALIANMVAGLEGKLRASPANVDGWIMLMRSRMTLNEPGKAAAALRDAIAANPSGADRLREQARLIGVPGA